MRLGDILKEQEEIDLEELANEIESHGAAMINQILALLKPKS
jgi:hypothetical protein